jgi:uncharacterized RDD family membrane protein YckC
MATIKIPTPFNVSIDFETAEVHKRILAYLIDFVLMMIYVIAIGYIIIGGIGFSEIGFGFINVMITLPLLFYMLLTELFFNGQSLGKKLLSIRVASLDGGEATFGQYMLRAFFRFYEWGFIIYLFFYGTGFGISLFVLGGVATLVIIAVSPSSQRLGDIFAGTIVVTTKNKLSVSDTVFMQVNTTDYKVTFPDVMRLSDRDINTIKGVVTQANKSSNYEMCNRVAYKVKDVLKINTDMYPEQFLEKLLEDYNYLATKE